MIAPAPTPLHIGVHAKARPARPAVVLSSGQPGLDYAELDRRSRRLAVLLRQHGLTRGDHIAVLMRNTADYLVVCCAAQRSGLYYTPVNWHLSNDEVAYVVGDCEARALIVSAELLAVGEQVAAQMPRVGVRLVDGAASGSFESLHDALAGVADDAALDECEGLTMFYSSGTTGRPKGIKRPALCPPWGTPTIPDQLTRDIYKVGPQSVLLSVAPLYHAAPLAWAMATLRLGGTVVLAEQFDALDALRLIAQHGVTHTHFVPTMFVRLLNLSDTDRARFDVSSLRYVVHAAAPCPPDVKRRMMDWLGPIVHEYYAGSENNGMCVVGPQEWLAHPGTVGKPLFGQVHILGDDNQELPTGEIGQIYFGGTPRFEYHNDPAKSASAFSKQGYSTLGDYGHVDAEGYVFIADRRTDLILSGGVNIYPRETEEALMLHPAVFDAAVIGVPSAEFGQDVAAVVQLHPGVAGTGALATELIEFCRARIAHFKCPRQLAFATLPRTATGKLLRRKLKEDHAELHFLPAA